MRAAHRGPILPRMALVTLLLAAIGPAAAQEVFVAPTANTIVASTEQGQGTDQVQLLYVTNHSTVQIVVFGVLLTSCENVKQWCGGRSTNITISANARRMVGRVEPKNASQGFNYRWTFSYRADSSDAKVMAALRENGLIVDEVSPVRRLLPPSAIDTSSPPGIEQPISRAALTPEERAGGSASGSAETATRPGTAFRFKVAYGSILGSTMMPGAPIQLTGPCIDPAQARTYDRDASISHTPWRPPILASNFAHTDMPMVLRDSIVPPGDLLVRFVTDTSGETIAGSVTVLESPNGLMSVQVCRAVISTLASPARNRIGRPIRAWVQIPVKVGR